MSTQKIVEVTCGIEVETINGEPVSAKYTGPLEVTEETIIPPVSRSGHTPGEWKIIEHWTFAVWSNQMLIAEFTNNPAMKEGEAEANARLIASAPELLEALQELSAQVDSEERGEALWDALSDAQQAIAKATGKEV